MFSIGLQHLSQTEFQLYRGVKSESRDMKLLFVEL